jgi:hypothetical protein
VYQFPATIQNQKVPASWYNKTVVQVFDMLHNSIEYHAMEQLKWVRQALMDLGLYKWMQATNRLTYSNDIVPVQVQSEAASTEEVEVEGEKALGKAGTPRSSGFSQSREHTANDVCYGHTVETQGALEAQASEGRKRVPVKVESIIVKGSLYQHITVRRSIYEIWEIRPPRENARRVVIKQDPGAELTLISPLLYDYVKERGMLQDEIQSDDTAVSFTAGAGAIIKQRASFPVFLPEFMLPIWIQVIRMPGMVNNINHIWLDTA